MTSLFTGFFLIVFVCLWILPVFLGIKVALKKNRSPHWMWFGIHPAGGWIAYLILLKVSGLKECQNCGEKIKTFAKTCPYCNSNFPLETITTIKSKSKNPLIPILLTISLCFIFIIFMFSMISGIFKSSESYKQTMEILSSNNSVINELGQPIKVIGFISGSITTSGSNGAANYSITVKGNKAKAKVYISSIKKEDMWRFDNLTMRLSNGTIIDLLKK